MKLYNVIISINANVAQMEGVNEVQGGVFQHFQSHFRSTFVERPCISNLPFKVISVVEGVDLIRHFSLEEFKQVVWDCDIFKSLGLDDINIGFVKDFLGHSST